MVEDKEDGVLFLRFVPQRSQVLQPIIEKHVKKGSNRISDGWSASKHVGELEGIKHCAVNHDKHFVEVHQVQKTQQEREEEVERLMEETNQEGDDAKDGEEEVLDEEEERTVHTNKIERVWREVKRGLVGSRMRLLAQNLNVELFRYNTLMFWAFEDQRDKVLQVIGKHQEDISGLTRTEFPLSG